MSHPHRYKVDLVIKVRKLKSEVIKRSIV